MDRNGISAKTDELLKYDVKLNDRVTMGRYYT